MKTTQPLLVYTVHTVIYCTCPCRLELGSLWDISKLHVHLYYIWLWLTHQPLFNRLLANNSLTLLCLSLQPAASTPSLLPWGCCWSLDLQDIKQSVVLYRSPIVCALESRHLRRIDLRSGHKFSVRFVYFTATESLKE